MYDPAISEKGAMLSSERSHSRLATNLFLPKHAVRVPTARWCFSFVVNPAHGNTKLALSERLMRICVNFTVYTAIR